ncbi:MAG TPA: hypothetical protein VM869_20650 [Enhygromyxa sp.]|nr:hypothetical protein [Enhygromyxa sp.]
MLASCGGDSRGADSDGNGIEDPGGLDEVGDGDGDPVGDGDGDPVGDGDGDGDPPGDGDGDGDATEDDDSDDSHGSGDGKWDTLAIPDGGPPNCAGDGGGDFEYSYLWAANSDQGTISKIDTKTVTEVGRYVVRPDSNGSPSRTSVSLSGHVAVANRNGGVTKIYADVDLCRESNGKPGIQTSNSAAYLPWGQEECVAWYKPMNYLSQRPVAWGPGTFNSGTCQWEDEELWTSGTNQNGPIDIYVLDGDDGTTKEMITVPSGGNGLSGSFDGQYYGIYGAAVDGDGNFWGSQLGGEAKVIRVNRKDMTWQTWAAPNGYWWYGMTVDSDGMLWLCSETVGRFDPETETWETNFVGGWTGCMADAAEDGLLWMANGDGVVGVNRDTLQVEKSWATNGAYGVSIDFEGYVWAVAFGSNVTKLDPATGQTWTYGGLVGAYTYSDMTGYALTNVGTPSG